MLSKEDLEKLLEYFEYLDEMERKYWEDQQHIDMLYREEINNGTTNG